MPDTYTWRFHPLTASSLLAEVTPAGDDSNWLVLALARALDAHAPAGVLESVPAINTLLVVFDPARESHRGVESLLRTLIDRDARLSDVPSRIVEIPVRYGGADGPDLAAVAEQLGLSEREVVALHCAPIYRVLLIGFAPGFPYLGPLPPTLHLPRRATPRTAVPAGSVAIAADMAGIYPAVLPGGWHLLGRTAVTLFDPLESPPSLLQPGDGVRFVPLAVGVVP
jgi:KipI family sensor histidine kinase inhibitor